MRKDLAETRNIPKSRNFSSVVNIYTNKMSVNESCHCGNAASLHATFVKGNAPSCLTKRIFLRLIVVLIPVTHDCVIMIHSMTPRDVLEISASGRTIIYVMVNTLVVQLRNVPFF